MDDFIDLNTAIHLTPSDLERTPSPPPRITANDPITPTLKRKYTETDMILRHQHTASLPRRQFQSECADERRRLESLLLNPNANTTTETKRAAKEARTLVRARWIEEGIWKPDWDEGTIGVDRWMHEDPLPRIKGERKPQRECREINRQASRPYRRFLVAVDRERIAMVERSEAKGKGKASWPLDVNSKAYEAVRKVWIKRRIWDRRWGVLPGLTWPHEGDFAAWQMSVVDGWPYPYNRVKGVKGVKGIKRGRKEDGDGDGDGNVRRSGRVAKRRRL